MRSWPVGAMMVLAGVVLGTPRLAPAQPTKEPVPLRYKWEPGTTLTYRLTHQIETMSPGRGGVEQRNAQLRVLRMRFLTQSVDDSGVATIKADIDAVRLAGEGPKAVQYDSEDPTASTQTPMAKAMAGLVGKTFTFRITPLGDAEDLEGMNTAFESIAKSIGAANMAASLKRELGDGAMEGTLDRCFKVLPDKPVAVGDAWKNNTEVVLAIGTIRSEGLLNLESVQRTDGRAIARIPMALTLTLGEGGPGLPPGMKLKMDGASGQGLVLFDAEGGALRSMDMSSAMPISMTAAGLGDGGADLTVSQKIDQSTKIELLDNGAAPEKKPAEPAKE